MSSLIGQQLGSFKIDGQLGSGAMGVVYRATHQRTGKTAAVKVITNDPQGSRASANDRFEREAEILQQFRHPNIVRFLAVGRFRGTSYFAMEFVPGRTLDAILDEREFLPWQEVVELGVQLCEALQYAHQRGVVHRDLKPSNIMVTEDRRVKLTDFGIAKDLDATALTATGRTLGTAAYMAPEQIRGTPEVSHKTDLYALGCLLYQVLTGEAPFKGQAIAVLMNAHLNQDPPRPSTRMPDVPRALDDLVLKLMSKSPSDRPWDAEAVCSVLQELRGKVERGEKVKMVFSTGEEPPGPAVSADGSLAQTGAGASGKPRKRKKKAKEKAPGWSVPALSTVGLGAVLLVLVGFSIYMLQPLSAEQLFNRARPLMESNDVVQWQDAERKYISELEERYPDHPYKKEVAELRDRLALHKASARVKFLNKDTSNGVESLYLQADNLASEAEETGNDELAARAWSDLAETLKSSYPSERGWYLLARKKLGETKALMDRRHQEASSLLGNAAAAEVQGKPDLARGLRQKLVDEYGQYSYLKQIVDLARAALPSEATPAPKPEPEDADESPETSISSEAPSQAEPEPVEAPAETVEP